uniref:DUF1907 domain-containing protein n=1 Tax=Anser cygnoides TaxID=8845 RepID=A0A8B9EC45_ANSCY
MAKVERFAFHVPSLEELAGVLQKGLKENFADAQVSVIDCPDLTQEPFNFPVKGNLAFLSSTKASAVLAT